MEFASSGATSTTSDLWTGPFFTLSAVNLHRTPTTHCIPVKQAKGNQAGVKSEAEKANRPAASPHAFIHGEAEGNMVNFEKAIALTLSVPVSSNDTHLARDWHAQPIEYTAAAPFRVPNSTSRIKRSPACSLLPSPCGYTVA
ncbi:hypothetical protein MGYG_00837 [Nannizzia gypsea CBS 118893]|uniref:Uncharacterized protein n=1 Tax=Arthroderma gypseum (strain ATCC MYA-4604 / CBS 118893) TaxID=535722 RepID=E5R218_ARTGP|nr:hypothetical protein MGYG_00837 [Nannizzia gypsea CBS 118893]EFQ97797.1 hypothetical protein MGYG_00837 [Nannizzia gypsea CBS 118893]